LVVVKVHPNSVQANLPSIYLYGNSRVVKKAYSSSPLSQCQKCWKFGHVKLRCKADNFTCPFCSLQHNKAEHQCPNPSCPKERNLKPILNCCLTSPGKCPKCGAPHSVRSTDCPKRPPPTVPRRESPPEVTQALIDAERMDVLPDTPCHEPLPSLCPGSKTPLQELLPPLNCSLRGGAGLAFTHQAPPLH